jgi:hypothetical protein
VMSLRPADLTTRSTPSPHTWFAWAAQGDTRSVISAPPPCPGLLYDFKSKLRNNFRRSESRDPLEHGACSAFVPSAVN